jgi:hypothetical protein
MGYSLLAGVAVAALGFAPQAKAIVVANAVPDAVYWGFATTFTGDGPAIYVGNTSPGTSVQNVSGAGYSETQSPAPDPTVTAFAVGNGIPGDSVVAYSSMEYYFAVVGPASASTVPVTISGFQTDTGGGGDNLYLYDTSNNLVASLGLNYATTAFSDTVHLTPNEVYEVELYAEAAVEGSAASAYASLDPSITVDPASAGQYSVVQRWRWQS